VAEDGQSWELVVARLVAERGDALVRYAHFVSGGTMDASDLVQDALVKTFGRLRNGYSVASAEAYVRRAILTTAVDAGRRAGRWRRIAHLQASPEAADAPDTASDARLDVLEQLRRLTPRERAVVVLRFYEDLKIDDIAAELGISPGAVKRYLSDALGRLGDTLGDLAGRKGGRHGR